MKIENAQYFCDVCGEEMVTTHEKGAMRQLQLKVLKGVGPLIEYEHMCSRCSNKIENFLEELEDSFVANRVLRR